jgi:hypothetical protein
MIKRTRPLLRRLIGQGRSVVVFLALSDKGEARAGPIEKGAFALGVGSLLSRPNALSRVRPIASLKSPAGLP